LLFVASQHDIFSRYRGADGWRALATNGLEVKAIDASHFTLMHEPHIRAVAQDLVAALDRALGSNSGAPQLGNFKAADLSSP
jgi:thioesterase domain-containing protein